MTERYLLRSISEKIVSVWVDSKGSAEQLETLIADALRDAFDAGYIACENDLHNGDEE